jgi:tetratricopeptide (TPR) repeat protein
VIRVRALQGAIVSPKNKGTFGRGKPPITDPDEFITGVQTTAERLKPYVPHIVLGSGAILVVSIAVALFSWLGERRAAGATASFTEVVAVTGQRVGMPMFVGGELKDPEFNTADARATAALDRLERLRQSYGSAKLSSRARLLEGKLLLELGRYDEARAAYRSVANSDASAILRVQAREGLGYSHEEEAFAAEDAAAREQGLERALELYEQMQPSEDGVLHAYALFHQGRVLAALGRVDEAIERLEKGRNVDGGVGVRAEIEDRLALLRAPGAGVPPPAPAAPAEPEPEVQDDVAEPEPEVQDDVAVPEPEVQDDVAEAGEATDDGAADSDDEP